MSENAVVDGRRARGDASRRIVLHSATNLASVEGLDGLSIGRLAAASGSSKSSIATLFRSKEGLQLATIAAAREIFIAQIVEPAREQPRGVRRLAALMCNSLRYSKDRIFTGGCFFAATAADLDSKTGPVSDAVRAAQIGWYGYIDAQLQHAVDVGEIDADVEVLAFELVALYEEANSRSLLLDDERPYEIAAAAMRGRLRSAGADESAIALLDL